MSETMTIDVAIIGGGPAGATLGALLARRGIECTVLDKDTFPRDKLCGEFLSWDALPILDSIGALEEIDQGGATHIDRCAVVTRGRRFEFGLPSAARGVSRLLLDKVILDRAEALGADVRRSTTVEAIECEGDRYRVSVASDRDPITKIQARVVVGAWGRWGRLDRHLKRPFVQDHETRHFGFKRHYHRAGSPDSTVELYSFRGGYLGASPVEGGVTNVCGLVHETRIRGNKGGWEPFITELGNERVELRGLFDSVEPGRSGFLSCEPVIFAPRSVVHDRIPMIGDAAGLIDPLTGNGMAMAIQSGLLVAGSVLQVLGGGRLGERALERYEAAHDIWFHDRVKWSRRIARVLSRPGILNSLVRFAPSGIGQGLFNRTRGNPEMIRRLVDVWLC